MGEMDTVDDVLHHNLATALDGHLHASVHSYTVIRVKLFVVYFSKSADIKVDIMSSDASDQCFQCRQYKECRAWG